MFLSFMMSPVTGIIVGCATSISTHVWPCLDVNVHLVSFERIRTQEALSTVIAPKGLVFVFLMHGQSVLLEVVLGFEGGTALITSPCSGMNGIHVPAKKGKE